MTTVGPRRALKDISRILSQFKPKGCSVRELDFANYPSETAARNALRRVLRQQYRCPPLVLRRLVPSLAPDLAHFNVDYWQHLVAQRDAEGETTVCQVHLNVVEQGSSGLQDMPLASLLSYVAEQSKRQADETASDPWDGSLESLGLMSPATRVPPLSPAPVPAIVSAVSELTCRTHTGRDIPSSLLRWMRGDGEVVVRNPPDDETASNAASTVPCRMTSCRDGDDMEVEVLRLPDDYLYLSQSVDAFARYFSAAADAATPIVKAYPLTTLVEKSLWVGPGGSVTGLHADHDNNLLVQAEGTKVAVLFSPADAALLSPSRKYDRGATTFAVDLRKPTANLTRHPLATHARPHVAVLRAGDALAIPSRWPHFVFSLTPAVSVALHANTPASALRETFLASLHRLGWYGHRHGCTCHADALAMANSPPGTGVAV
eukprot:TRINITY_DN69787_c0_g1_i1.p1 TRINITY_DN69787_c0_g1~~TRINITY_DN69787_c0_g1_i1.p1  ORF type:complete len:432 (+),score=60.59 TRINITY_DN69787_c0_g1_i1:100-1395(+)